MLINSSFDFKFNFLLVNISYCTVEAMYIYYMSLLNYVPHTPWRLACLTCLTHIRDLHAFAPYVSNSRVLPYLRSLPAFSTRLAHLICASQNLFYDEFVVQQEPSISHGLLKILKIMLFLCGSKNSSETF